MNNGTRKGQSRQSIGSGTKTRVPHSPLRELRNAHDVRRDVLSQVRRAVNYAQAVLEGARQGREPNGSAGRRLTRSLARALVELEDGGGIASSMDLIGLGPVA